MLEFISSVLMNGLPVSTPRLKTETVKSSFRILTQLQLSGSTGVESVPWQSAVGAECVKADADLTLTVSTLQRAQMLKRADASIMSQAAQNHTGSSETTTLQLHSKHSYHICTVNLQYFNK